MRYVILYRFFSVVVVRLEKVVPSVSRTKRWFPIVFFSKLVSPFMFSLFAVVTVAHVSIGGGNDQIPQLPSVMRTHVIRAPMVTCATKIELLHQRYPYRIFYRTQFLSLNHLYCLFGINKNLILVSI